MQIPYQKIDYWGPSQQEFLALPPRVIASAQRSLEVAAQGGKGIHAKPLRLGGIPGSKFMEIVLRDMGNTYRVVYSTASKGEVWIIRAFMKKSSSGIKTSRKEIDLIRRRALEFLRAMEWK